MKLPVPLLPLPLVLLTGCSLLKPSPSPVSTTAGATTAAVVTKRVVARQPRQERLLFHLDHTKSTGLVATTLDPMHLGPRKSSFQCPLRGTISGELRTSSDGSRTFTIDEIDLASHADGHLHYSWTPLIGSIRSVIRTGILTIHEHTIPGMVAIDSEGKFSQSGCHFKVGGTCQVQGHGLLLKKQVGTTEEDLTIAKTDPIVLSGTLVQEEGRWLLHVPSAVMKDRFDLDEEGSVLDLEFNGNIFASTR